MTQKADFPAQMLRYYAFTVGINKPKIGVYCVNNSKLVYAIFEKQVNTEKTVILISAPNKLFGAIQNGKEKK